MALKEIKQKIYKKEKVHEEKPGFLKVPLEHPFDEQLQKAPMEKAKKTFIKKITDLFSTRRSKMILIVSAISLAGLIFLSAFMYQKGQASFDIEDVVIEIETSEEIISGEEIIYSIYCANNSRVDLKNVEITFHHPKGFISGESEPSLSEEANFKIWQVGEIKPEEKKVFEISGKLIGEKSSIRYAHVKIKFNPSNFSSTFEKTAEAASTIAQIPLILNLVSPKSVPSKGMVDYILEYSAKNDLCSENLKITFEYPEGFTPINFNPQPTESDNIWIIKEISEETDKIEISGTLSGKENEIKILKAVIEAVNENKTIIKYAEESSETRISQLPLSIWQAVNGKVNYNADCSEELEFIVNYKNNSDIGLRKAIITSEIFSEVVDMATLKVYNGAYDDDKKQIIWTEAGVPELGVLEPGEIGSVSLKIIVKKHMQIDDFSDKNFNVKNISKIDSPDIPTPTGVNKIIASNEILVKINSRLVLSVKGYYNDDGRIKNSGPIPPKIGETTSYTIHWQILNLANDVQNVEIKSVLPNWVAWTGEIIDQNKELRYDERTGSIIWQAGNIPANTGILSPIKEIVFQVNIKPIITQKGALVRLLEETTITGKDNFTEENLETKVSSLSTDLPDDPSVSEEEGRVIE
jgi:hypothetical protein